MLGRDPELALALDGPNPLRVQPVPAVAWNGRVTLWWVAAGPLTTPTLRYVALWDHGQGDLDGVTLTDDTSAFERATLASVALSAPPPPLDVGLARRLGLLFVETTRPMDRAATLLTPESAVEDGPVRTVTELVFTDPRDAAERTATLIRLARLGRDASPRVISALLYGEPDGHGPHALPAHCLDADERHALDQSLAARFRAVELETGGALGEAWPPLPMASTTPVMEKSVPFGSEPLSLDERRSALESFGQRRESPRVYAMGDRMRFQALVAVQDTPGLLELTFWRDGRVRSSWTKLSR